MRYAIIVLAFLGVLASPRPAAAAITGNQFLEICKTSELACTAYVMGWREAFVVAAVYMKGRDSIYEK